MSASKYNMSYVAEHKSGEEGKLTDARTTLLGLYVSLRRTKMFVDSPHDAFLSSTAQ